MVEYRVFLDAYTRLNTLLSAGSLQPEPRLRLNSALAKRKVVPISKVALARAGEEPIRAEHSFTWRLSQDDQKQIDEVRSNLTKYREVPNEQFSPRHEAAGEGEIRRALSVPYLKRGNLSLARVENRLCRLLLRLDTGQLRHHP